MAIQQCDYQAFEPPLHGFWQRLGHQLQRLGKLIARWDQLEQQRRQLNQMDDRQLKDIGISRADIQRITGRRRFWDNREQEGRQVDDRYRSSDN